VLGQPGTPYKCYSIRKAFLLVQGNNREGCGTLGKTFTIICFVLLLAVAPLLIYSAGLHRRRLGIYKRTLGSDKRKD
jgi:hypothetical protein